MRAGLIDIDQLRRQRCITLDDQLAPKKEIAYTRSFGTAVTELEDLVAAVTRFASGAAVKLRAQNRVAGQLMVFAHTSPFRPGPKYCRSLMVPLRRPTAHTIELVHAVVMGMNAIYRPGINFAKAGVMLLDLQPDSIQQGELNLEADEPQDRSRLMSALDGLNERYGRGTVLMASAGLAGNRRVWSMKQERRTPGYTTCVADMPVARA